MIDSLLLMFIFLIAGVISVPIASRFGLGSVLGYLIAGILISPILAILQVDVVAIQHFAEFEYQGRQSSETAAESNGKQQSIMIGKQARIVEPRRARDQLRDQPHPQAAQQI